MSARVAIVTDSTATLPDKVAAERGIAVVPLQVIIGATVYDEGAEGGATPEMVAAALKEWRPVSTSRPTPAALLEAYEAAARDGATEVLSIHLSGDMSGTFESAQLAARDASVRVVPIDTRQVGVATGFAALTAADVIDAGARSTTRRGPPGRAPTHPRRCSTSTRWSTSVAVAGSAPRPPWWAARSR